MNEVYIFLITADLLTGSFIAGLNSLFKFIAFDLSSIVSLNLNPDGTIGVYSSNTVLAGNSNTETYDTSNIQRCSRILAASASNKETA